MPASAPLLGKLSGHQPALKTNPEGWQVATIPGLKGMAELTRRQKITLGVDVRS